MRIIITEPQLLSARERPTASESTRRSRPPHRGILFRLELAILRALDSSIQLSFVEDVIALYEEHEVLRARDATVKTKPQDVKAYFKAQFRRIVRGEQATPSRVTLRATPTDDPYG